MDIVLRGKEVYEILEDRFGKAEFRLLFLENESGRKRRTGKDIRNLKEAPPSRSTSVYLGKEEIIIPD